MGRWRVEDVMTTEVVTVREDTAYRDIVEVLASTGTSAVPVLDSDRHVVGIVSEADLLPRIEYAGEDAAVIAPLLQRRHRGESAALATGEIARELMTSPAVTIEPQASLVEAVRVMEQHHVKRLPVVNPDNSLVGIVSRRDLLRVHLRTDDEIRASVLDQLYTWFRTAPPAVDVEVRRGVVFLSGELDRSRQVPLAIHLTRHVDGVIDVVDKLSYRIDDTRPA
jgi:CBS domain-containing protein